MQYERDAQGAYHFTGAVQPQELLAVVQDMLAETLQHGPSLTSPRDTAAYCQARLATRQAEAFLVLFLDNRHRVIAAEELFQGTIDGASVHPREVVRACLKHNAAAVIFAHNHPSGVCEPSRADEHLTNTLRQALALIDVRVLDHFIVAATKTLSFAERGLL